MKVLALLCSLFAIVSASSKPTFVTAKSRALDIRGGATIGPLDEHLAVQLAKAGAAAYVAGAGSKFVADKTGASSSQLADFVTTDLFGLNALCAAFAAGMYGLGDTGFDTLKAYVLANALALTLKVLDGGSENAVDTVMDNKVLTASVLAGLYLVYG
mmetsp:Transcript_27220/g.63690  ORF Transcript_27220/g.63690 Transcript_27220/m.63690 type:complete len:157 (-) Transcript_27220:244-714(-)|eukprot:CAMPEP_0185799010 /NCGR_PEP_ID=MMETSP1322-20130828/51_1 /TAXON_ID=265543 /ORGANISM="Minutocellus polymorphus, Strain RCC2270" /LENGTH=156 /DNA_ID=CAMNT_0028494545 /DNA_START=84 /DNA_END=554 /DNA_ORIENTATION=-